MSRILVIESSARQQGSVSRQLTADFIAQWQAAHPSDDIQVRDLAVEQVPHLAQMTRDTLERLNLPRPAAPVEEIGRAHV